MLRIRGAQLVAFMDPFVVWTVNYLRTAEASRIAGWSDDQLRERVTFACSQALDHGLDDSQSLLRFIVLALSAGPQLAAHPQVEQVLGDTSLQPEARLDALIGQPALLATITAAVGSDPWSGFDSHALSS